jgi:hypothetical protein
MIPLDLTGSNVRQAPIAIVPPDQIDLTPGPAFEPAAADPAPAPMTIWLPAADPADETAPQPTVGEREARVGAPGAPASQEQPDPLLLTAVNMMSLAVVWQSGWAEEKEEESKRARQKPRTCSS